MNNAKKQKKTTEQERLEISLRKSEIPRNISCKIGTIKDKNDKDLTEGINKRWQKYTE